MAHHTPTPAPRQDIADPTAAQRISPATPQPGDLTGRRLGDYHLSALLGVGGMADVYRAYDSTLMRDVAVKVLSASLAQDPDYVARFRQEARRVAALSHPHLVPVYHAGEETVEGQRRLYLVMPLLHESLEDLLAREGKASLARAVGLVVQVADGLHAAHRHGLIHRDVKPGNILLDAEGHALLTDFGLAREVRWESRAASQQPWGTPEYMAPEHLRGDAVDQRADVYALGVVLYELLTGKRPFDEKTAYDIAARVPTTPLQPPSIYDPSIPAALDHVVLTAVSREPDDRYPGVDEFSLAVRRAIHQQSGGEADFISAVTVPLPDQFWSARQPKQSMALPSRRRSLPWLLASLLAVILLVAGLSGTLLALQLRSRDTRQTTNLPGAGPTAQVSPTDSSSLVSIQTPQPTSAATNTPHTHSTPTANTATATATPTATVTTAPLTIAPTPLVLTPSDANPKTCVATQTVTNNTTGTVGWFWQKPAIGGFHFQIDGKPPVGWPTATTNTPPHGQDTLVVTTDCKPPSQSVSYGVLLEDSLGGQYTFIMTVQ